MTPRRLYRCRDDRRIAGVAAGIAEYLELDPTVVRVAWIISALLGGFTIVLYVILAFAMPLEPASAAAPAVTADPAADPAAEPAAVIEAAPAHAHRGAGRVSAGGSPGAGTLVLGVLLVTFGAIALAGQVLPGWITGIHLGPAFVVALGVALIVGATRRTPVGS